MKGKLSKGVKRENNYQRCD